MKNLKSKIIIGTWSLSGDLGPVSHQNTEKLINYCISNGLKEFDLAPTYGFGNIDKIFSNFKDKNLKINTKFGYDKLRKKNFSISVLKKSIYESYSYHGRINALFLHNPRNEIKKWSKVIEFMNNLKDKKIIKYMGISLARDFYIEKNILNEFDYVQDEINLLRLGKLLHEKNKFKLVARSPLATGILSNNFNINSKFTKQDYRYTWLKGKRKKVIICQNNELRKIFGKNIMNSAYAYLLHNKNINKIIFGFKDIIQLKNIIKIHKLKKLPPQKEILLFKLVEKKYFSEDVDLLY